MATKSPKPEGGSDIPPRADPSNASNEPSVSPPGSTGSSSSDAGSSPESSQASVADAYAQFMKRMAQASSAFEKQYNEQLATYTGVLEETERQIADTLNQAAQRYSEQLKKAWGQSELATKVSEAYQRFSGLSKEYATRGNVQRSLSEAYTSFLNSLTQAAGSSTDHHRAYLDALQKGWEQSELQKRALEAHAEYLLLLQQWQQQNWQRAREAKQAYERAISEALSSPEPPKRAREALEKSMQVLQQAWEQASQQYKEESARVLQVMEQATASIATPPGRSGDTDRRAAA